MHGGAGGSGVLGVDLPVEAAAGRGISGGGGAEIPAPNSGISFCCGWVGEESVVPPSESEAPGHGVPPNGCGAGGGPVACESGFS